MFQRLKLKIKISANILSKMEVVKVVPEDLLDRFRSKRDLYSMLTKDRKNTQ